MHRCGQLNRDQEAIKLAVKKHREAEPCEWRNSKTKTDRRRFLDEIDASRYSNRRFIPAFGKFEEGRGLEIGLDSD
jgi:hypothetical protein